MTVFKAMVVPLALESGELCTGQVILQPISLKSDRLLALSKNPSVLNVPSRMQHYTSEVLHS